MEDRPTINSVNIWDLEPGQICLLDGVEFIWLKDTVERRPVLGRVPIRVLRSLADKSVRQKFIRGIEVEILPPSPYTSR